MCTHTRLLLKLAQVQATKYRGSEEHSVCISSWKEKIGTDISFLPADPGSPPPHTPVDSTVALGKVGWGDGVGAPDTQQPEAYNSQECENATG